MTDLPKSASLPVATVQASKARFMDGTWDFDYLFFTESDQVRNSPNDGTWNTNYAKMMLVEDCYDSEAE
jgi:hypothetical protein